MANGNSDNEETKQQNEEQKEDNSSIAMGSAANTLPNAGEVATAESSSSCAHGTLNDLVADLCLNGPGNSSNSSSRSLAYGDYTNIRATVDKSTISTTTTTSSSGGTTATASTSSFSFKHFLNSSATITAPSTTVTSLDAVCTTAGSGGLGTNTTNVLSTSSSNPLQTSTGARPKVPQSASVSLMPPPDNASSCGSSTSKMKRSPRFSSFDSQASLAEYAAGGIGGIGRMDTGACSMPSAAIDDDDDDIADMRRSRLFGEIREPFGDFQILSSSSRYVPRSYSSYDMPPPVSPRRRSGVAPGTSSNRESRPNRLAFSAATHSPKMKLDLPLDTIAGTSSSSAAAAGQSSSQRILPNSGAGDYAPAAAAALPDFVQDHWLDSWYAHDMHLNSPPNSPICDFGDEDLSIGVSGAVSDMASGGSGAALSIGSGGGASDGTAKMLPDFLSDGPIIHSSQRLADVAAGLPSNTMGSPQDMHSTMQLSTLRQENDRLQRELSEARMELNVQIRRANELERQLQQQQQNKRAAAATAVTPTATTQRYREQVVQMRTELAVLRRENEMLRNLGNDVGARTANCDRSFTTNTAAASDSSAATVSTSMPSQAASAVVSDNLPRPSNNQQLGRELLRAAANAEFNLRQLLVGVDNLRQMAAGLQSHSSGSNASPDLCSDFPEENQEDLETYDINGTTGGKGANGGGTGGGDAGGVGRDGAKL